MQRKFLLFILSPNETYKRNRLWEQRVELLIAEKVMCIVTTTL
jgi:hypothetical protein